MNPNHKIPFVDRIREYYNDAMHWRSGDQSDDDDQFDFSKSFEKMLEENRQKHKNINENKENLNNIPSASTSGCSSRYKTCNEYEDDSLKVANKTTETYDSYKTTKPSSNDGSGYNVNQSDGNNTSNSDGSNFIINQTDMEPIEIEKLLLQCSSNADYDGNDGNDNESFGIILLDEPKLDDTLEVVEYIPNESKYVLKPLSTNKRNNSSFDLRQEFNSLGNNEAKSIAHSFCNDIFHNSDMAIKDKHNQSADDVIDLTNFGDQSHGVGDHDDVAEVVEVVPDEDDEGIEVVPNDEQEVAVLPNVDGDEDIDDYDESANTESDIDWMKSAKNIDDDLESHKKLNDSLTIPTDFNDSIERMEFMMKRGEELLKKQQIQTTETLNLNQTKSTVVNKIPYNFACPSLINKTPKSQVSSPILKPHNFYNSPKKNPSPFKRPGASIITPGVIRKPPTHQHHQYQLKGIPKLKMSHLAKSTTPSPFSHIKSPISVYINNRQIPTLQNVHSIEKKRLEFPLSSKNHQQNSADESDENLSLDFTILNTKNYNSSKLPTKLPIKTHIKANTQLVTDLRDEVIPGGQKIKSLFGAETKITRHLGHDVEHPQQILDNTVVATNNFMEVSIVERPNIQRY